ncbi:MAG: TldD/PmbA family protein [Candidatus Kapaibacterium sp.]
MKENRREFLKKCGLGAGAVMTSGLWLSPFLGGCSQSGDTAMSENIYGLTKEDMEKILKAALSKGGDFADLFFEYNISNSVRMSEDIIKSSSESIAMGVGVRVLKGSQTGFGYTNDMNLEKIIETAKSAAAIASSGAKVNAADLTEKPLKRDFYKVKTPFDKAEIAEKIELIRRAYDKAINHDNRVKKVSVSLADEIQYVTIANSEGLLISDVRPQARLMVSSTAEENGKKATGYSNAGGRVGMAFYLSEKSPEEIGRKASEEAVILLSAKDAPAGEMPVVLSKDQSGVMIHEAVGHPLEGDGAWKKTSLMWDKLGKEVASPMVTIYDDATIPNYRGSLNIDDEGVVTENVPLIENGKLVGYLNDRLAAKMLGTKPNGHGRRESFRNPPIPRMNNTVLASGDHDPEEIIGSVKKGFYAISYQGGMVNNTGQFTFSINLGYMIEDGKLAYPLKNATLIGSNIGIMKDIDMVGNDMGYFLGTCGKDGQSVPVTAGTPTLRIKKMTVGGIA